MVWGGRWEGGSGLGTRVSLGGWYTQNGGDNVDIGEDGSGEREDKNDNSQSKVH